MEKLKFSEITQKIIGAAEVHKFLGNACLKAVRPTGVIRTRYNKVIAHGVDK